MSLRVSDAATRAAPTASAQARNNPTCPPFHCTLVSLRLAAVAVAPSIFISEFHFPQSTYRALGGTSVLIVVGVALQTMRQVE